MISPCYLIFSNLLEILRGFFYKKSLGNFRTFYAKKKKFINFHFIFCQPCYSWKCNSCAITSRESLKVRDYNGRLILKLSTTIIFLLQAFICLPILLYSRIEACTWVPLVANRMMIIIRA
jgi:hypothetical protein